MVLYMSDSIRALARNIVLRKKANADRYVLFLGAGASISSGCSSMMQIVDDVLKSYSELEFDKWENNIKNSVQIEKKRKCFFDIWDSLDHGTQYSILKNHLWKHQKISDGYDNLVKLIKNGFVNTIFSTNLDNLLERALINGGLKQSDDFVVVVNGKDRPEVIAQQLNSSYTPVKIIKLHGSLEFPTSYAFTPKEIFDFESQIKSDIFRLINQSLIIVGYSVQDRDAYVLFEEKGNEIHFVNPTIPDAESRISQISSVRGKGTIISGNDGDFDTFFRKLLMYTKEEEKSSGSTLSNNKRANISEHEVLKVENVDTDPSIGNAPNHLKWLSNASNYELNERSKRIFNIFTLSEKKRDILFLLDESPKTLSELKDYFKVKSTGILTHLKLMEDINLITRYYEMDCSDDMYRLGIAKE